MISAFAIKRCSTIPADAGMLADTWLVNCEVRPAFALHRGVTFPRRRDERS